MAQWWKRDALFFVFAAVAYETVFAVPYYAIRRVTQRSLVALLAGFAYAGLDLPGPQPHHCHLRSRKSTD